MFYGFFPVVRIIYIFHRCCEKRRITIFPEFNRNFPSYIYAEFSFCAEFSWYFREIASVFSRNGPGISEKIPKKTRKSSKFLQKLWNFPKSVSIFSVKELTFIALPCIYLFISSIFVTQTQLILWLVVDSKISVAPVFRVAKWL